MDINSICNTQLTDAYEERIFQNDVIDLRILGDIDSVCIYRGNRSESTHKKGSIHQISLNLVNFQNVAPREGSFEL